MIKKFVPIFLLWLSGFGLYIYDVCHKSYNTYVYDAEGIVVLTGAKGRIDHGLKIMALNSTPHMLITGVRSDFRLDGYIQGQPSTTKSRVDLGYKAYNTSGNAIETAQWTKDRNIHSIILVTSDYHIRRALLEFYHYLPHVKIYICPLITKNWQQNCFINLIKLSREYNKLLGSSLRFLIYKIYDTVNL